MAGRTTAAVAFVGVAMLALAPATSAARGNAEGLKGLRISPRLDPESHAKFYKDDYPSDARLHPDAAAHHFSHPFPIMQESHDFDKDYIQDENHDSGEWKAQEDYDRLRIEIVKVRENATKMAEWERKEREEWEEAQRKAKDAAQQAKDAAAAAAELRKRLKEAEERVANLTGASFGNATLNMSTRKEEHELEKCLEALEKAQAELDKLLAEKERREAEHKAQMNHTAATDKAESQALREEEAVAEKLRLAQESYDAALKRYNDEKAKLESMLADLDASAARLRKFRAKDIDQDGGVYRVHKAAAGRLAPSLLVLGFALWGPRVAR